jgi:hypothetical protein
MDLKKDFYSYGTRLIRDDLVCLKSQSDHLHSRLHLLGLNQGTVS